MALGTEEKTERNEQLARDYLATDKVTGQPLYEMSALIAKYGISQSRIYLLLKKAGVPILRKVKSNKKA